MFLLKVLKVTLILGLSLMSCSRRSSQIDQAEDIILTIEIEPQPIQVGVSEMILELRHEGGEGISNAKVSAQGDMTHAGMTPVFGEAKDLGAGFYQIPFEWTMAGSWILTIEAELPDGRTLSRVFEINVSGHQ